MLIAACTRSTNGWRHGLPLNADGINALREQGRAAVMAVLKKHTAATQDTIALPRYWRFADELPRNTQAKIVAADFQTAFSEAQIAPEWPLEMENPAENEWQISSRVPLDLVYFGGHFAQFPLVPGVVELQWVRDFGGAFRLGAAKHRAGGKPEISAISAPQ